MFAKICVGLLHREVSRVEYLFRLIVKAGMAAVCTRVSKRE